MDYIDDFQQELSEVLQNTFYIQAYQELEREQQGAILPTDSDFAQSHKNDRTFSGYFKTERIKEIKRYNEAYDLASLDYINFMIKHGSALPYISQLLNDVIVFDDTGIYPSNEFEIPNEDDVFAILSRLNNIFFMNDTGVDVADSHTFGMAIGSVASRHSHLIDKDPLTYLESLNTFSEPFNIPPIGEDQYIDFM